MQYGRFSQNGREYVITRPDTPTPWINYLGNTDYCAMISNTAGGYSFHIDPRDRRILRYRYNNLPMDRPGRYLYIRDNSSGEYWSPTWQPTLRNLEKYECRHGLGYTKISSVYSGIEAAVTYFVPLEENLEIWMLELKNHSPDERELSVFSYAEFCLWRALQDQNDLQSVQGLAVAQYEEDAIFYNLFDLNTGYAYFSSSGTTVSYDCNREKFIGLYRDESNPQAVEHGSCFNSAASGGNPIAATCNLARIRPNKSAVMIFVLGVAEKKSEARTQIQRFKHKANSCAELQRLEAHWDNYLSNLGVNAPDDDFRNMVNVWNQYQCRTTFDWSRYVSFYETGIGRGMGFRDSNQDVLGIVHASPRRVRLRILELARNQFKNGRVYHLYYPLTGEGGFPEYVKKNMKFFSDDHLWLVLSVAEYVKETGDITVLNEKVPFVDGANATIYEHLRKAIGFTLDNMGDHDLPLLGTADWNDPLSIPGPNNAAESVWTYMLFHKALLELITLAGNSGKDDEAKELLKIAGKVKAHINKIAWDGSWYIRAFADSGDVLGSSRCEEGRIYLNAQSWAIISEIATKERGIKCMDSVKQLLDTEYGIMLLAPAYSRYHPEIGDLSSYAPGLKENASIWSHANAWAIIAECMLDRGNHAYEYYKKIAPTTKNKIADIHRAEPYVYAQTIAGIDHPDFGMARNSWLTGTAAWMMKAASNWILGIRPQYRGLLVDPCIPRNWDEFCITRKFRDATYEITVSNPGNVSKGIEQVTVDETMQETNLIPDMADGKKHLVNITMG